MNLKNKVIVITGGTKGIGSALALLLKSEGAKVIVCSHNKNEVEKYESEHGIRTFVCDVRKEIDVQSLAVEVIKEFGHIDIWVNNAGVFHVFDKNEKFVDMEKAKNTIDVNFFGTLFGCRTALKNMNSGLIVNIISTAGLDASRAKNLKIYAASKWAVRGYTQAITAENENGEIKILSVYPGGTQTDLYREGKPDSFNDYMTPEHVAGKIVENLKLENPEVELVIKRPGK